MTGGLVAEVLTMETIEVPEEETVVAQTMGARMIGGLRGETLQSRTTVGETKAVRVGISATLADEAEGIAMDALIVGLMHEEFVMRIEVSSLFPFPR